MSQNFFDDYETITVDGCNFDEYLKKFRNVDVVKFDVEGHEYSIFENLSDENIQKSKSMGNRITHSIMMVIRLIKFIID